MAAPDEGLVIGYVHPGEVAGAFCSSLTGVLMHDVAHHERIVRRGAVIDLQSGPRVAEARSQVIDIYAEKYAQHAPWLLFIDTDMVFEPDAVERLLAEADPREAPIVGGLCFAGSYATRLFPTLYRLTDTQGRMDRINDYPEGMCQVDATGAAFLLVHRDVLSTMQTKYGRLKNGKRNRYPWFVEGILAPDGMAYGEDIAFCLRARELGIPIHVNTTVKVGHMKTHVLTEDMYQAQQAALLEPAGV